MSGMITGCIGGVLRDVLCNEIPLLFGPTETLYATAAIAGAERFDAEKSRTKVTIFRVVSSIGPLPPSLPASLR